MLAVRETERDSNEEKSNFIFFNESLTLKNRLLLKETKEKKKKKISKEIESHLK